MARIIPLTPFIRIARLRDAGATAVVVPEMAGAFMMLDETLILLGMPHDHIFTGIGSLRP